MIKEKEPGTGKGIVRSLTAQLVSKQRENAMKKFTEKEIEAQKKCTYFLYGNKKLKQPHFNCARCDETQTAAICMSCFFTCHRECHRTKKKSHKLSKFKKISQKKLEVSKKSLQGYEENNDEEEQEEEEKKKKKRAKSIEKKNQPAEQEEIKESRFQCVCGKKNKHHRSENKESGKDDALHCELMSTVKLPVLKKNNYYCIDCNTPICVLCKFGCHEDHSVISIEITSVDSLAYYSDIDAIKRGLCKCQDENHITNEFILGLFFDNARFAEKYKKLVETNNTVILNALFCYKENFQKITDLLQTVLEMNSGDINSAENPDMKTTLVNFTTKFNKYFSSDNKNYYFHDNLSDLFPLKISISYIENLIDNEMDDTTENNEENIKIIFNLVNIIYFIHFKKNLQPRISLTIDDFITSSITDRLIFKNFYTVVNEDLVKCTLRISEVLQKSLKTVKVFYQYESYANCMKIILYALKRMMYSKSELETLIINLYNFHVDFHAAFAKNIDKQKENFDNCYTIFYSFIRIALLITITYNDFVTKEIMESSLGMNGMVDKMNKFKFLHEHEVYGDKLLKIIIKICYNISMVYRGDVEADETFVHYHNEVLKLFCVSDNAYLKQIDGLTIADVNHFKSKLKNHEFNETRSIFDELQNKINENFDDYFKNVSDILTAEDNTKIIFDFGKILGGITKNISAIFTNKTKFHISHFQKKVFKFASLYLPFENDQFEYIDIDILVSSLIQSNIKQLFAKYLTIFKYDELNEADLNFLFGLMSLFLLNLKGSKFFCRGKLVVVICKLVENLEFLKNTSRVKFIYILVNAIKKNKINIKEHKIMSSFPKILNLLTNNNEVTTLDLKTQRRIVKIFILLKTLFEFEEFQSIKYKILACFSFVLSNDSIEKLNNLNSKSEKDLGENYNYTNEKREEIKKKVNALDKSNHDGTAKTIENKVFIHTYNYRTEKERNSEDKVSLLIEREQELEQNNSNTKIQLQLNNNIIHDADRIDSNDNENQNWERESNSISSQGNINDNDVINQPRYSSHNFKIFFLMLKLQCYNTYYFFDDDKNAKNSMEILNEVLKLEFAQGILSSYEFPFKYRKIIIRLFRTFYFFEKLKETDYVDRDQLVNSEEIYNLTIANTEDQNVIDLKTAGNTEDQNIIEKKANAIDNAENQNIIDKKIIVDKMITVMEIFIKELEDLDILLYQNTCRKKLDDLQIRDIKLYLFELLISIKSIAEFIYYEKRLWTQVTWIFYKLTKRLLDKAGLIQKFLININGNVNDFLSCFKENNEVTLAKTHLEKMELSDFDFYNKEAIFDIVVQNISNILSESNSKIENHSIEKFLINYDYKSKMDFTPKGLASSSKIFGYFYNNPNTNEDSTVEEEIFLIRLKLEFNETFINIINSSFMRIFKTSSIAKGEMDHKRVLIEYFVNYLASNFGKVLPEANQLSIYRENQMVSLITVVTKLLYYDTENTQSSLEYLNEKYIDPDKQSEIGINLNKKDNSGSVTGIEIVKDTSPNITDNKIEGSADNVIEILPAEMIQEKGDICQKFFFNLYKYLQKMFVLNFATVTKSHYFDRYIEISNITKLIIQFLQLLAEGFNSRFHEKTFELKLINRDKISFFTMIYNQLKTAYTIFNNEKKRSNRNIDMQHNKLITMIMNIIDFEVEYIEGSPDRNKDSKPVKLIENFIEDKLHKFILDKFQYSNDPMNNYEMINCRIYLYIKSKFTKLITAFITKGNVEKELINTILKEIPLFETFEHIMFYIYSLLLKFRGKYKQRSDDIFAVPKERFLYVVTTLYINDAEFRETLELRLCVTLFEYLKIMSDSYERKQLDTFIEEGKIFKDKINYGEKKTKIKINTNMTYKVYAFMETLLRKVELKTNDNKKVISFFVKPHYAFFLSKWSRRNFMEKINRETRFSKLTGFLKEIDYFMFEMLYLSTINYKTTRLTKKFEFRNLEIINYIMVSIQQIMLLIYFFKSGEPNDKHFKFTDEEKYQIPIYNLIFSIIHIFYLIFVIIFWMLIQYPLSLRHDLMHMKDKNERFTFLYNKTVKEYSYLKKLSMDSDDSFNAKTLTQQLNKDIPLFMKLKISLTDTILMNKKVNVFFLTLLLTLLYLILRNAILVVLPIFFIVNLVNILFGIVQAIQLKWKQLLVMLIFTYLCIYFFTWVSFYFTYPLFQFSDSYVVSGDFQIAENHCTTAIQCFLTLIDLGFRSGGGIGDWLPKVSFRENPDFFLIKFFYNITFHIFIILIMGNIFFGIIVDAFSDLRDKNNQLEEDKNNICFICQLGRDKSLNKNINFENHKESIHYAWNYVYFITYLFLTNPHDFNTYQNEVWTKINSASDDISWIPGESDEEIAKPQ